MIFRENICIGTGFSALIINLISKKKITFISSSYELIKSLKDYKRRINLERHKKIFSKNIKSYGKIDFLNDQNIILHDTLLHGGDTNLWGGFINISNLNRQVLELLKENKIQVSDIKKSGEYYCADKNVFQLRYQDKILNASYLFKNYIIGHVTRLEIVSKKLIKISYYNNNKLQTIFCKNLFIATGLVQLFEILSNSNFIKQNDIFTLYEFKNIFKITLKNKIKDTKNYIMRYSFSSALKHYLGLKKNYFKFFDIFLKIFVDQIILKTKQCINLKFFNNSISIHDRSKINFGKSIHYSNLHINSININKHLKKINKNIYGISKPFVVQNNPGPISNCIINHVYKLLKKNNFQIRKV